MYFFLILKTYLFFRPPTKNWKNTLLDVYLIIIADQNILFIIHVDVRRFSAGATEYGRQHIGLYYSHKLAHAFGGGNSSVHFGGVDTDHLVESRLERLLQVKGSQQYCKHHRRCSWYRRYRVQPWL